SRVEPAGHTGRRGPVEPQDRGIAPDSRPRPRDRSRGGRKASGASRQGLRPRSFVTGPQASGGPGASQANTQPWSPATAVFGSTRESAAHTRKAPAAYGAVCVNAVTSEWLPREPKNTVPITAIPTAPPICCAVLNSPDAPRRPRTAARHLRG